MSKQNIIMTEEDKAIANKLLDEYGDLLKQRSETYDIIYDLNYKININQAKLNEVLNKYMRKEK